ncbi:MAG TPA: LEA type 2 family protein [Candidatus Nanoarchaeia archaeon]|nr:LEA type 2 family protein [Candidatus Nanoarchaeia archaeon]
MNAWWVIAVVLVVLLGLGGYVYDGLSSISVSDFEISSVDSIDTGGFSFVGTLDIDNPSIMTVTLTSLTYDVVLNQTEEVLGQGSLGPVTLPAGEVTEVDFTQSVRWKPTVALGLELLAQDKVYLVIHGTARIDILGIYTHEAPVEVAIDIKNLVTQWAQEQAASFFRTP